MVREDSTTTRWTASAPSNLVVVQVLAKEPLLTKGRLFYSGAGVGVTGAVGTLLYNSPPGGQSLLPPCPLYYLTGLWCPGCGSGRAIYSLMHGDVASFVTYNPVLLIGLLIAVGWGCYRLMAYRDGRNAKQFPFSVALAMFYAVLAFGVLRNLEPFMWLAPHPA